MSMFSINSSAVTPDLAAVGGKGIEIDHHHVDGRDAVRGGLLAVVGVSAAKKNSAMHLGVEGFDAAAEHFGRASEFSYIANGDAGLAQKARRAAGGNDFDSQPCKLACKIGEPCFVIDTDESAFNRHSHLRDKKGIPVYAVAEEWEREERRKTRRGPVLGKAGTLSARVEDSLPRL